MAAPQTLKASKVTTLKQSTNNVKKYFSLSLNQWK